MTTAMQGTPEMRVGHWIRHARREAKKSQAAVALACGVSRQLVGRWEDGDINSAPDINQYRMLAEFLKAPWLWEVAATCSWWYCQFVGDIDTPPASLHVVH